MSVTPLPTPDSVHGIRPRRVRSNCHSLIQQVFPVSVVATFLLFIFTASTGVRTPAESLGSSHTCPMLNLATQTSEDAVFPFATIRTPHKLPLERSSLLMGHPRPWHEPIVKVIMVGSQILIVNSSHPLQRIAHQDFVWSTVRYLSIPS